MALTRAKKESIVEGYDQGLAGAEHAFVLGFQGITVNQVTDLRSRVRAKGGRYLVIKNSLARKAVSGKPLGQLEQHFRGATAIVVANDPVSVAKVLTEFKKQAPVLEFKAGLLEGQPITGAQVADVAQMASREQLIAKLVFLLQSPVARFVRVLAAAGPQRLATVVDQIRLKKEGTA